MTAREIDRFVRAHLHQVAASVEFSGFVSTHLDPDGETITTITCSTCHTTMSTVRYPPPES